MTKIWHGVLAAVHVVFSALAQIVVAPFGDAGFRHPDFLLFAALYRFFLFWIEAQTDIFAVHISSANINFDILFKNRMPFDALLLWDDII